MTLVLLRKSLNKKPQSIFAIPFKNYYTSLRQALQWIQWHSELKSSFNVMRQIFSLRGESTSK